MEDSLTKYFVVAAISVFSLRLYFHIRGLFRPLKLKDKHVLITGGSSGLGKEIAKECYYRGAYVTVLAKSRSSLLATMKELEIHNENSGLGNFLQVFDCNLATSEGIEAVVDRAERRFGPVFLFIGCSGTAKGGFFLDTTPQTFKEQMKSNFFSTVNSLQPVAKRMTKRQVGHVCLVGSYQSYTPVPGMCAWSASKCAVESLAKSIRPELERFNVKVYLFSPGPMETPGYYQAKVNKTDLVDQLEGRPIKPEVACSILLNGIAAGDRNITTHDFLSFIRVSSLGGVSRNNLLLDAIFGVFSVVAGHFYSLYIDFRVRFT